MYLICWVEHGSVAVLLSTLQFATRKAQVWTYSVGTCRSVANLLLCAKIGELCSRPSADRRFNFRCPCLVNSRVMGVAEFSMHVQRAFEQ